MEILHTADVFSCRSVKCLIFCKVAVPFMDNISRAVECTFLYYRLCHV
jgi:hypothetical protein